MVIGDSELGKGVGDIGGVRIRGEEGEGGSVELGGEIGGGVNDMEEGSYGAGSAQRLE